MEKIKRPVKLNKNDMQVLSDKNFKKNTDTQFETVYDKVDEIVDVIANGYQGDVGPIRTTRTSRSTSEKMELMGKMERTLLMKILHQNNLKI